MASVDPVANPDQQSEEFKLRVTRSATQALIAVILVVAPLFLVALNTGPIEDIAWGPVLSAAVTATLVTAIAAVQNFVKPLQTNV